MNISQLLTKLKTLVYSKSETDSLLGGKASSSHTHTKSQITDFPTIPSKVSQLTNDSGFITGVSWANVTGKPSTFTPSSHTHTKNQITDFPSLATVATSGSYTDLSNKPTIPTNTNQLTNGAGFLSTDTGIKVTKGSSVSTKSGGYWAAMCNSSQNSSSILPTTDQWWHVLSMDWTGIADDVTNWCSQLALPTQENSCLYWRRNNSGGTSINNSTWHKVIDDTNIGSQNVNYANSSGWANHAWQADYLGDIGSTDRNSASGTGWYSVGFSYSYDEGHNELAINNYWGIRLNCRDSSHVTINGNRIIDSGNTGNISISGYQVYVG